MRIFDPVEEASFFLEASMSSGPKLEVSQGYCPFSNGPRGSEVMGELRQYDSNLVPDLESVTETYFAYETERSVTLLERPVKGATSVVFETSDRETVVKYQSNCYRTSEVHPVARDYFFLKRLENSHVSPRALYLSGSASMPETEGIKTLFQMKGDSREACASKGGSVRFMVVEKTGMNMFQYARSFPDGRVPIARAVSIGIQVIKLLQKIHALGIVHNDVHWGNVVFRNDAEESEVMLIDFGRSFFAPEKEPNFKLNLEFWKSNPHFTDWEIRGFHPGFRDDVARTLLMVSLLAGGFSVWKHRLGQSARDAAKERRSSRLFLNTKRVTDRIDYDAVIALIAESEQLVDRIDTDTYH